MTKIQAKRKKKNANKGKFREKMQSKKWWTKIIKLEKELWDIICIILREQIKKNLCGKDNFIAKYNLPQMTPVQREYMN